MGDGRILAWYRPTARQVLARGLFAGAVVTPPAGLVAVLARVVAQAPPLPVFCALPVGVVVLVTLVGLGGRWILYATERGLAQAGPEPSAVTVVPWHRITGMETRLRRWRTVVVVRLESGATWRLRAPYQGRWLGFDPLFEQKLLTLRNLWETYRTWTVGSVPDPPPR